MNMNELLTLLTPDPHSWEGFLLSVLYVYAIVISICYLICKVDRMCKDYECKEVAKELKKYQEEYTEDKSND